MIKNSEMPPTISGFLERTAKYTKKWVKRFVIFNDVNRKISYGESPENNAKATMTVQHVTRCCEVMPHLKPGNPDLYSMQIDGSKEDGQVDTWSFRFPDEPTFSKWYYLFRDSLSKVGVMEPRTFGLPPEDPRSGLAFQGVPLQYLYRFGKLERAIVFYFQVLNIYLPQGISASGTPIELSAAATLSTEHIVVVSDKLVYLFRYTADIVRCFNVTLIDTVFIGKDYLVLKMNAPEHDLILQSTTEIEPLTEVLKKLFTAVTQGKKLLEEPVDLPCGKFAEGCRLTVREGYKLAVSAPTPKIRLRQALDAFEKANGMTFTSSGQPEKVAMAREPSVQASDLDMNDPMVVLLIKLNLKQYIPPLRKARVDMDMLSCFEPSDLVNFGVNNPEHRDTICQAAQGRQPSLVSNDSLVVDVNRLSGGSSGEPEPKKVVVDLDDDDEDLPPPATLMAARKEIVLDSDSDDDMLPVVRPADESVASPTHPPPVVNLSDDDDI